MTCAVFFNLDGTLVDHDLDYPTIYDEAVGSAGVTELSDGYEAYTDRFFRFFQDRWTFPRRQAMAATMQDRGIADIGQSDRFAEAWEDAEADRATPLPGAADVVTELGGRYSLGIATNGTGRLQRMKLEAVADADRFDAILISSEIGVAKPHAGFFEAARDRIDADRYVIVSDELRRDILPAKREDFLTVWVSAEEGNPQVEQLVDRRAAAIDEVPDAVDALCR